MFGDRKTERFHDGERIKQWQPFEAVAHRRLDQVMAAADLGDLSSPGNNLEKLKGDLKDYWSVRINDQWRIIFKWGKNGAMDIKITDYH